MRSFFSRVFLAAAVLAVATMCFSDRANASWILADGFSDLSPTNAWKFGTYSGVVDPTTFAPFSSPLSSLSVEGKTVEYRGGSTIDPNMIKNVVNSNFTTAGSGQVTFNQNKVVFGPSGGPTVARWTAATAGLYDISADFLTVQVGNSAPDAYVYKGNMNIFTQLDFSGGASMSSMLVSLAQGDTIDFVVGGPGFKSTQVDARITAVPEPASLVIWGLGAVGLMIARRRPKQPMTTV
jgi:hypothetical protein